MAHRVSYEIFRGPIPDGMFVRHTLDIPNDVNPNNLILGTQADNMRDKVERGRQPRGSAAGAAKLDEAAVHEIRRLCAEGKTSYYQLGKAFGVSASTIRAAAIGKTWAHI
ncbi:HNH endonuclease signature motif containing protein [Rhodococcus qingshengii]|uniref:HNH endonuclease signature motif containing protein n=1 Tax=Rhodococcus qingshengii TaxID=334542 RepID=UPI001C602A41|nr:HNH endonuclease [Rhodococcus qingshengii]